MDVLNALAPIFLLVALGKWLRHTDFLSEAFAKGLNKLTYWFALPALLVYKIAGADLATGASVRIFYVMALTAFCCILAALLCGRLLRMPPFSLGAFIQGAYRGNIAYVGLAAVVYAMNDHYPEAGSTAAVALALTTILYNLLAVSILLFFRARDTHTDQPAAAVFLKQLITNPLLLACLIGLTLNYAHWPLPEMIERTLNALGGASLAMALLSIGATLSFASLKGTAIYSVLAACIKVFLGPLIGFGLIQWLPLSPMESQIALMFLACPTAAAAYVMADILGSDAEMTGRIIVLTTLFSALSLSITVLIYQ